MVFFFMTKRRFQALNTQPIQSDPEEVVLTHSQESWCLCVACFLLFVVLFVCLFLLFVYFYCLFVCLLVCFVFGLIFCCWVRVCLFSWLCFLFFLVVVAVVVFLFFSVVFCFQCNYWKI